MSKNAAREYTIEITTRCQHGCNYCSTNALPDGYDLPIDDIKRFIVENSVGGKDRLNISGGEPLSHPKFWDILQLCKNVTKDVWVYTNALENIRYNSGVIKEITCEANVCLTPGEPIYLPKYAKRIHLLQLIPQGRAKDAQCVEFNISSNIVDKSKCKECGHLVLQANGEIASSPCKKDMSRGGANPGDNQAKGE